MLIYLNRTGYNGLFRVNASGEFNVPPGRYDSAEDHRSRAAHRGLAGARRHRTCAASTRRSIACCTRRAPAISSYFDPPYAPLSATANFRGYTGRGFADADQSRLQEVVIELARRGVQRACSATPSRRR